MMRERLWTTSFKPDALLHSRAEQDLLVALIGAFQPQSLTRIRKLLASAAQNGIDSRRIYDLAVKITRRRFPTPPDWETVKPA